MVNVTGNVILEIAGVLLTLITYFMMSYYYSRLLKPRKESKFYILKYFLTIITVYFICRTNNKLYEYRFIPLYLTYLLIPFIFSSDKKSKKILASLSWVIATSITNYLTNGITSIRFGITYSEFNSIPYEELLKKITADKYGMLCVSSFSYTTLSLFVMTILIISNKNLKNKLEIFFINLFTYFLAVISTIPAYFFIDFDSKIHILIGLVSFTASIFIMIFSYSRIHFFEEYYKQKAENSFLKDKNKMQLDYYKERLKNEEEIRKINHDIKNNIQVMAFLKNDNEKEKMLQKITDKLNENENVKYSKLEILNIILNLKMKVAKEKGLDLKIEIRNSLEFMEEIDISNLFSNILDNAIENIDSKNKTINLSVYGKMNYIIVKCSNTIDSKKKKKDKGKDHGYGLKIINDIAKKYNGEVKVKQDSKEYEITILLAED